MFFVQWPCFEGDINWPACRRTERRKDAGKLLHSRCSRKFQNSSEKLDFNFLLEREIHSVMEQKGFDFQEVNQKGFSFLSFSFDSRSLWQLLRNWIWSRHAKLLRRHLNIAIRSCSKRNDWELCKPLLWHNENLFYVIETRESLPASRSGRNLKVKNHRKWKLWGYLIVARLSSRWVSGRVGESWEKSLLLMLRETCNKKINHRLQFSEGEAGWVSNSTAAKTLAEFAGWILRCGQPLI